VAEYHSDDFASRTFRAHTRYTNLNPSEEQPLIALMGVDRPEAHLPADGHCRLRSERVVAKRSLTENDALLVRRSSVHNSSTESATFVFLPLHRKEATPMPEQRSKTLSQCIKQAISHCGLCGAERSSADKVVRTPISKQRNKHIQHVLVEAAKLAPRQCHELALIYEKEAQRGNRNRATLAVAIGTPWSESSHGSLVDRPLATECP
jgi:hypothetical protein